MLIVIDHVSLWQVELREQRAEENKIGQRGRATRRAEVEEQQKTRLAKRIYRAQRVMSKRELAEEMPG